MSCLWRIAWQLMPENDTAVESHSLVRLCKLLIIALGSGRSSAYSALEACRFKT